eukprot:scaffold117336_cov35-Tisochrysis_lutea.AAC.1
MLSSSLITLVRASAVSKKASGESGHPCGLWHPADYVKGKASAPVCFMYLIGLASALVRARAYLWKSRPKLSF